MSHPPPEPTGTPDQGHRQPGPLRQFAVILLRNESTELMQIVRVIMELTHFCRDEATHKMWQAHHRGRSLVLKTHQERAELFVEQFAAKGVRALAEPI